MKKTKKVGKIKIRTQAKAKPRTAVKTAKTAKRPASKGTGVKSVAPKSTKPGGTTSGETSMPGHHSKRAPAPVGPYPHARRVGEFIFVSGMGPRTPGGEHIPGVNLDAMGRVLSRDISLQTHSVIQNIKNVLEDMGSGLEDVVDVTVFLTHMKEDFKIFNKVYGEYFAKIGPTRTTVEVLSLPTPIDVELKVIAHCP